MKRKPKPARGFAALSHKGEIIPNSVRGTRDAVRLSASECTPIPVLIVPDEDGVTVEAGPPPRRRSGPAAVTYGKARRREAQAPRDPAPRRC